MKNLIKTVSSILILALLTGMLTTVSASSSTSVKVSADEALEVLQKLNIVLTKDKTDDFSENKAVTKGDFSIYLVRALKMPVDSGISLPFSDVKDSDSIAPYIKALYGAGVVHGYNNEFNIYNPITYNEAIKMMVSAIGYGHEAELSGPYPAGYLKMADKLKITRNLNLENREVISKKEAALLLFNMLNAKLLEITKIEGSNISYKESDETIFSKFYNIYSTKGRVIKNSKVSILSDNDPVQDGYVQIDDELYLEGDTDVSSYIGYEIEFYFQYDEDTDESEIILVAQLKNDRKELYINAKDIQDFAGNKYTYYDETGKVRTVRLSDGYYLVYNKSYPQKGFTSDKMKPVHGGVRLVWGDGSGNPDVVMIDEYISSAVSSIDVNKQIIYTKDQTTIELSSVDYKIYNANGRETELSAIKEWDVISQAWSADRSQARIYISNETVSGTVSAIGNDGMDYAVIDGKEYSIVDGCFKKSELEINDSVTAYLDIMGCVAAFDIETDIGMEYAYLMKAYVEEDEEKGHIRVFDSKGITQNYILADKVEINDVKYKDYEAAVNYLSSLDVKLVKFETRDQKTVNSMVVCDGTDKYIHRVEVIQYIWNANNKTFGGRATMPDNAPVFVIPGDDVSKYKIESIRQFSHDSGYGGIEIYTTGDNVYAEVILRPKASSKGVERHCGVVASAGKTALSEDGEETRIIGVAYNGNITEYELDPEITEPLNEGDIIQLKIDDFGIISNVVRLYDAENDTMLKPNPYEPQTGAGYRSYNRAYMGYVYNKDKGLMKFGPEPPTKENFSTAYVENALLSGFTIYVVDMSASKKNRVYVGTENDIVDFHHNGAAYSRVMVFTMWNDPEDIVIIKQ